MAELLRIVDEARATHRQIQAVIAHPDDKPTREIVRLRTRLATLLAEIMGAAKSDPRLQHSPQLAAEFESKFAAMRQSLAAHQAVWRSADIDQDLPAYRRATEAVGDSQDAFYAWASEVLPVTQ